jgi:hypothetical protein
MPYIALFSVSRVICGGVSYPYKMRAQRVPREKPSEFRPSNYTGGGICYKAVRFFGMYEFAKLFVIHMCVLNRVVLSYNA